MAYATQTPKYSTVEQIKADTEFLASLEFPEIQLYLLYAGRYCEYYAFRHGSILFYGNDFKPSPLHTIDSIETLVDCLSFLCLKPGDTDPEYFENYTSDQLAWANSMYCERLQGIIGDYEDDDSEYYNDALMEISVAYSPA